MDVLEFHCLFVRTLISFFIFVVILSFILFLQLYSSILQRNKKYAKHSAIVCHTTRLWTYCACEPIALVNLLRLAESIYFWTAVSVDSLAKRRELQLGSWSWKGMSMRNIHRWTRRAPLDLLFLKSAFETRTKTAQRNRADINYAVLTLPRLLVVYQGRFISWLHNSRRLLLYP